MKKPKIKVNSKDVKKRLKQLSKGQVILGIIGLIAVVIIVQVMWTSYQYYHTNRVIAQQQVEQQDAKNAYLQEQKKVMKRLNRIQDKMNDYIKAQSGEIGVSFYEINSQEGFNLNGDVKFVAGNMTSIPLALVVAGQIDKGNLKWTTSIPYEANLAATNSQISASPKSSYTVDELMKLMIENEDATARQLLINKIGGTQALLNYMKANDKKVALSKTTDTFEMAPQAMLHFILTLYENKDNSSAYGRIMGYMAENQKTVGRLYTSETAGDVEQVYADVDDTNAHVAGIIEGKRPFIITIFTKGESDPKQVMSDLVNIAAKIEKE